MCQRWNTGDKTLGHGTNTLAGTRCIDFTSPFVLSMVLPDVETIKICVPPLRIEYRLARGDSLRLSLGCGVIVVHFTKRAHSMIVADGRSVRSTAPRVRDEARTRLRGPKRHHYHQHHHRSQQHQQRGFVVSIPGYHVGDAGGPSTSPMDRQGTEFRTLSLYSSCVSGHIWNTIPRGSHILS
jgi:hypothetical protein